MGGLLVINMISFGLELSILIDDIDVDGVFYIFVMVDVNDDES